MTKQEQTLYKLAYLEFKSDIIKVKINANLKQTLIPIEIETLDYIIELLDKKIDDLEKIRKF